MKKLSKFLFVILAVVLLYGLATTASAEEIASGKCGTNLSWTLDDAGTLTISGTGAMTDYSSSRSSIPWYSRRSSIKSVVITDGVTAISDYAFYGCGNLTSINLPEGLTTISDYAFYGCGNLTTVTLPEGLTSIGSGAFSSCKSLASITIPASVTSIATNSGHLYYSAFAGCTSLTEIRVSEKNKNYCDIDGVLFNKSKTTLCAYPAARSGNTYTVPKGVTSIHSYAFDNCDKLTTVTLPEGLTSIGSSAFCDCTNLTSMTIPIGVVSIGHDAFYNCKNLISVSIPEGITTIGTSTFHKCTSLTKITIPIGVTSIGAYAFQGCTALTEIIFPKGVVSISAEAFSGCTSLTEITLPEGLKGISESTFRGCTKLKKVTLPKGVTFISNGAFYECFNLTEINFPKGLSSIGISAFYHCYNLTELTFREGLNNIGKGAFQYCSNLLKVTLPASVNTIEENAFQYCAELRHVYYGGTEAGWAKISIGKGNETLLAAQLHTICENAEAIVAYIDNENGTHTMISTCSGCGSNLATITEACKDDDWNGFCDGCGAVVVFLKPNSYSLLSLTLRDGSGKIITSIPAGNFYAEAKVKKVKNADPALIMLVAYTREGKMLSTAYLRADVPIGTSYDLGSWIDNEDGKVGEVKAFLLSSLNNPIPLSEAISVK